MMKSAILVLAATVAGAAALSTGLSPHMQDVAPAPVVVRSVRAVAPDPVEVCPNPCAHCALTPRPLPVEPTSTSDDPAAPKRRAEAASGAPGAAPFVLVQDAVQTSPQAAPAPARRPPPETVPPSPEAPSAALALTASVTLPDGRAYSALAPLPQDHDGFTWRTFKNRATPDKTILGLHVYAPRQDPDLIVGTIRWSNGAVRPNGTGFCGLVYYDSFTLKAPQGWDWVVLPTKGQTVRGNTWVLISAPPEGDHVARPREMLEWSYALVPSGNATARAKADAALRYQDVVIPDPVTEYGPTRTLLPTVDRVKMAATCKVWATMTLGALANGTKLYIDNVADVETEQLGAHWMDGSNLGYAYGGFGIDPTGTFAEQVPDALLTHAIMHRANVARQFLAAYDLDTGQPIGLDDWTSPPNPALMMGEPNMSSRVELQPFLVGDYYTYRYPHFNEGTCKYEFARTATVAGAPTLYLGLWDYETHDVAHSVRAFRNPIQLVEFTKDPAARDDILMFAEVNRYGWFSDRPDERTRAKNPSDGYWATTLTSTREALASSAHQGGWFDRNWAWSAFAGACAIAYDNNPQRVAGWKAWGRDMLDTTSLAVDKFGFTGRTYSPGNFPANVGGIQTFHEMLVMTHRITLAGQVFDKIPTELAAINRRGLMSALAVFAPRAYGDSVGPPHWIGTIDNGHELSALSESYAYGEGDPAHVYAACAMTYRADPTHPEVLDLALKHWHPNTNQAAMLVFCQKLVPNKAWSVEMESVLQQKLSH